MPEVPPPPTVRPEYERLGNAPESPDKDHPCSLLPDVVNTPFCRVKQPTIRPLETP